MLILSSVLLTIAAILLSDSIISPKYKMAKITKSKPLVIRVMLFFLEIIAKTICKLIQLLTLMISPLKKYIKDLRNRKYNSQKEKLYPLFIGFSLELLAIVSGYFSCIKFSYSVPEFIFFYIFSLIIVNVIFYLAFLLIYVPLNYISEYLMDIRISNYASLCIGTPFFLLCLIFIYNIRLSLYSLIICAIIMIIVYLLLYKILILCLRDVSVLFSKNSKFKNYNLYLGITSLFIILFINLYTHVLLISHFTKDAYATSSIINGRLGVIYVKDPFDLIYFTIISLTTTGFGDIVPHNIIAKLESVLIGLSSISYLTIFLGSILSSKINEDKIKK